MDTRFSIGEVAKLHNISLQTLRHYDKIGLLKPAYVNENSNYRYYSVKHFIIIDLIKQCKAIGLSLDEIKNIVNNYTSVDSILDIITNQKELIEKKMVELQNIKNNILFLEDRVQTLLKEGINEVFLKYSEEKKFVKYNNTKRYTEEFEINLSKILSSIEQERGCYNKELAFLTSYEDFKDRGILEYDAMMININDTSIFRYNEVVTLKEGTYVTINFDDDYKDTSKYYSKILEYIEKHHIKVTGDFYEIYIMTRRGTDDSEKSLGQIQIRVEE